MPRGSHMFKCETKSCTNGDRLEGTVKILEGKFFESAKKCVFF